MAGEFNYNGEHSLIISGKNTWETWHMAPKSRPYVAAPPVKEEYVDVPGADGSLDYTEVLTGAPRYGRRTGSWEFFIENGWKDPFLLQSELLSFLHGKKHTVILADDPEYFYTGRLTVEVQLNPKDYNTVSIKYNFDPYKYPTESTATKAWKWNDLFGNTIYYGPFTVKKKKRRTIIMDTTQNVNINVSNPMVMDIGGTRTTLATGDNTVSFSAGSTIVDFIGSGRVVMDYSVGKRL
jgi:hypothetical protein